MENAQSQNIDFLIEQAINLWEKRSDTNAVKQANYFLGSAYNEKKLIRKSLTFTSNVFFFKPCF